MFQILPNNQRPRFSDRLNAGLKEALPIAQNFLERYEQKKNLEAENQKLKDLGYDVGGITSKEGRQAVFSGTNSEKLEKAKRLATLQENREIISQLEQDRGLAPGSLKKYESNPAMAEKVTKPITQKKTQASQPIDPEQLDIIKKVRETPEFQKASPAKKYQIMTDAGASKENAEAESKIFAEEQKTRSEQTKAKQHEREFFHTESKKYDEALTEQSTAAEKKNRAMESQLKIAHKLGKWDRVISAFAGQTKWGDLLKSSNAQEFDSYALPQMEGLRQILGGVLSDSDIRLIMQKVVTSSKTPEANEKIAKYLMSENNYILSKKHIGDELKRNNGGYRPANYESEIDRIFKERYGNKIRQEFEELQSLPDDPKKLDQVGRRIVPPGTSLSNNAIKMYLELANNDPVKATEMAEEDGYDVPK